MNKINIEKVDDSYIYHIVEDATLQVKGVSQMAPMLIQSFPKSILGKEFNVGRSVKIYRREQSLKIEVYILVEFGVKIPELAWTLQRVIKNQLEKRIENVNIDAIDIHVQGINY